MGLSTSAAEQTRDQLIQCFENESKITLKVIRAIPTDKLNFKPHTKSMGMGELVWHLIQAEQMFIGGMLHGAFGKETLPSDIPKEQPATTEAIAQSYEKLCMARIGELKAARGEVLAKELNFHNFMIMPAIQFLQVSLNHSIHHRGQLSVYLRLVDAKVPSIYGPSADDNPFAK